MTTGPMSHSDQQGYLSASGLQEAADYQKALLMAQEENGKSLTQPLGSNASSGLNTPPGSVSASGSSSPGLDQPRYASKQWRDEVLPGYLTHIGRPIRPWTTSPSTPAADPAGSIAAASADLTADPPASTSAGPSPSPPVLC